MNTSHIRIPSSTLIQFACAALPYALDNQRAAAYKSISRTLPEVTEDERSAAKAVWLEKSAALAFEIADEMVAVLFAEQVAAESELRI